MKELVKLPGLSETTKDEDICKAVRQMLLEIDAGCVRCCWKLMLDAVKMCGRLVKLYKMQGLLHYFAMLSDI